MSHYITAEDDQGETICEPNSNVLLDLEFGMTGPSELFDTGLDIYGIYHASDLNAGISGTGESATVDEQVAKGAYVRALAWAEILRHNYPNLFENPPGPIHISVIEDDQAKVEAMVQELIDSKFSTFDLGKEEIVKRCVGRIPRILQFTRAVYEASRRGTVRITFG